MSVVRVLNVYTGGFNHHFENICTYLKPKLKALEEVGGKSEKIAVVVCQTSRVDLSSGISTPKSDEDQKWRVLTNYNATFYLEVDNTESDIDDSTTYTMMDKLILSSVSEKFKNAERIEIERLYLERVSQTKHDMVLRTFTNVDHSTMSWRVPEKKNILFHGRPVQTVCVNLLESVCALPATLSREKVVIADSDIKRIVLSEKFSLMTLYRSARKYWTNIFYALLSFIFSLVTVHCEIISGIYESLPACRFFGFNWLGCGGTRTLSSDVGYSVYLTTNSDLAYKEVIKNYAERHPIRLHTIKTVDYNVRSTVVDNVNVSEVIMEDTTAKRALKELILAPFTICGIVVELFISFWMVVFTTLLASFLHRITEWVGWMSLSVYAKKLSLGLGSLFGIKNKLYEDVYDQTVTFVHANTILTFFVWLLMYGFSAYFMMRCVNIASTKKMTFDQINITKFGWGQSLFGIHVFTIWCATCYASPYIFSAKCILGCIVTVYRMLKFIYIFLTGGFKLKLRKKDAKKKNKKKKKN